MSKAEMGEHKMGHVTPSATEASSLRGGYNQTYVILKNGVESSMDVKESSNVSPTIHETLFRCGNWCYKGNVDFMGLDIGLNGLPALIPCLQRQQSSLKYFCTAKSIPPTSRYFEPVEFFYAANDFVASEITSDRVSEEMKKWASVFNWIDDDSSATYFELNTVPPECMKDVAIMASKTYSRGLIVISIFLESTVYFIVQGGEGDQHLLDVRFPDVSKRGQGLHVASYKEDIPFWRRLTLWHSVDYDEKALGILKSPSKARIVQTTDISSTDYIQAYCILKSKDRTPSSTLSTAAVHEAMFRFGSWCYAGSVQLTPIIELVDIPFVIPALRIQQSRLAYFCDVKHLPAQNKFARALEYLHKVTPVMEDQIVKSEDALRALIDRLNKMNLGDSVARWLEGESEDSFFEFKFARTPQLEDILRDVELIASKAYHASGVVTVTIMFEYTCYVLVMDGSNENPLLDSRFPDVSSKGRGYQLQAYADGIPEWPELRKTSVWQTVDALEQEFRERASQLAQVKADLGVNAADAHRLIQSMADNEFDRPDSKECGRKPENETLSTKLSDLSMNNERPAKEIDVASEKLAPEETRRDASVEPAPDKSGVPTMSASPSGRLLPVSRGHHLPKMDNSLQKKMEELRRTLGPEGAKPAWAGDGRPLGGGKGLSGADLSQRERK